MARTTRYTAEDISVLDGLAAVRKRPGMYIGGTDVRGYHHLLWEIVDNAVDEHIGGHATTIEVWLDASGDRVTVRDNGRGIPVDEHPTQKRSALEVVLTTLHAGGKFERNGAYVTSGGLHGVGLSVVNALSSELEVRVRRDGKEYLQEYRRGRPKGPPVEVGPARGSGTTVSFTPDPEVFDDLGFDAMLIRERLEVRTWLHKGLKIIFKDRGAETTDVLEHPGGVADYLSAVVAKDEATAVSEPFVLSRDELPSFELALCWTDAQREKMLSHVNGIPTPDGGTHEQGLRDAVTKAVRAYAETHNLVPRGLALTAEDVREGLTAILSTYVEEPQFQGQTKGRLNSPEARSALDATVRPALEQWLHHNPSQGQAIVARTVLAGRARIAARDASAAITRRSPTSGRRLNLPGKLSDCQATDSGESELFIVEGDSAGGSAKQARNRKTQAVLPLRGKVLNAEQATLKKVLENEELNNIALALGCGIGPDVRVDRLRYGRIILLMDADSDGHHISTLLLTFFYRYMRALLEEGRIFLAMPPLFRVDIGKATFWALDERDRDRILREHPRARAEITRFKGLGEMPPKMLFETTLDPARRRLMKVDLSDAESAARVMDELMGKDPRTRYDFIMEHAAEARDLDI